MTDAVQRLESLTRRRARRFAMATFALALAAGTMSKPARAATPATVVVWVEGPGHEAVRAEAGAALGEAYTVGDTRALVKAMGRDGQGSVGARMRARAARARLVERVRRAARETGADDVVVVAMDAHGRASVLTVDAASAETSMTSARRAGLNDAIKRELARVHPSPPPETAVSLAQPAAPPAPPTPAPAEPPVATPAEQAPVLGMDMTTPNDAPAADHAASPVPATDRHRVGHELFELALGGEVGARHFRYSDGLSPHLRDYDVGAAPLLAIDGSVYPFAASTAPVLPDLGLVGGYARAFALRSDTAGGSAVGTAWSRFHAGARWRLRTGSSRASPILGLSASYGTETFGLAASNGLSDAPSVDYRFVRPAVDARIPLGRAALFASAAYLFVLSSGDVADRFSRATVGGVQGELGAALAIVPGIEARLSASYRRFFYSMNPVPGDANVAGGALDELEGLQASVAYVY